MARVQGLGRRMPLTSFGIVICGLSLIGVPGTAGFVSKWYLILAALEKGQWWLVFLIVASSLLAAGLRLAVRRGGLFPRAAKGIGAGARAAVDGRCLPRCWWRPRSYFGLDTAFTVGSATRPRAADGGPR